MVTVFTSAESLRRAIRATIEKRINPAGKEPSNPAVTLFLGGRGLTCDCTAKAWQCT